MKKITFLRNLIVLVALLVGSGSAFAQTEQVIYSTGFESAESFTASTTYNNTTVKYTGPTGQQWGTYYGTPSTTGPITGTQSLQMRWYASAPSNLGYTFTNFDLANVTKVVFKGLNTSGNNVTVSYSTDGGSIYTGAQTFTLATSASEFTYNVSATGEYASVRLKFQLVPETTDKSRITIDDVQVYGMVSSTPTVATPSIEVTSGVAKTTDTYFNTAEITLSSSTDGAAIYYTLDGNDPTTSSTLYSAPFNVTTTSTVKALAVKAEMDDSGIASKTITIVAPATATVPYSETFNNTLGDWYPYEVAGAKPWVASANGAIGNGYSNPNADIESWLISPKFTVTEDGLALSFNYASKYPGDPILVKVSNDYIGYGSPAAATWTTISTVLAPEVQDDAYTVKSTGNIIHASSGTVYFALVYDAAAAPYSDWRITNASVILPPTGPTISVVEADIPEMSAYVDASDSETITVNGVNLTTGITVALGGTDAAQFRLSTSTLAQTDGAVTDASVTIYYEPKAAGSHTATLTLSSAGAADEPRSLSGTATWAPLDAPVATDASGISQTGFTANWNAVAGATEYELSVSKRESGESSEALDQEFTWAANGTGGNDGLWNGSIANATTGLADHLVGWTITAGYKGFNCIKMGSGSAQGVLQTPALALTADATLTFRAGAWDGSSEQTELLLEITGGGALSQSSVQMVKAAFTSYSVNITGGTSSTKISFKGKQTSNSRFFLDDVIVTQGGEVNTPIVGSPFTVVGTSRSFSGLNEGGTFVYTVKAKNANVTYAVSNEIVVEVAGISVGTDNPSSLTNIYAHNAKIHFAATAGEKVEVYNAVGQKIISTLATDGQNELSVNAKGVMIVKVGSRLAKVIL